MNKTDIKYPRYHSKNYISFDFINKLIKKHHCKKFSRQSSPYSVSSYPKSTRPRCSKFNKATYINHKYKYYSLYRNRKYNHVFSQYNNLNIDLNSNKNLAALFLLKKYLSQYTL